MKYFLVAFGVSVALTYLARAIAYRAGWMTKPHEDRWHCKPIALTGGIAILLAYFLPFLWFAPQEKGFRVITAGAGLMFAVGLADDFIHLPEKTCFCMHIPLR